LQKTHFIFESIDNLLGGYVGLDSFYYHLQALAAFLMVRVIVFHSFLQVFGYSSEMFFRIGLTLGFMYIPFCDRNNMKVSVCGQRNNFVDQGIRDFLPYVNWLGLRFRLGLLSHF